MKLLLDTHTFLWFSVDSLSNSLPQATKELLENESHILFLSIASIWEMAIKASIGKLILPQPVRQIVNNQVDFNNLNILDIRLSHIGIIESLPFHHKDPFDRLLISQAQSENLTIVSTDSTFDLYGINRLWLS